MDSTGTPVYLLYWYQITNTDRLSAAGSSILTCLQARLDRQTQTPPRARELETPRRTTWRLQAKYSASQTGCSARFLGCWLYKSTNTDAAAGTRAQILTQAALPGGGGVQEELCAFGKRHYAAGGRRARVRAREPHTPPTHPPDLQPLRTAARKKK